MHCQRFQIQHLRSKGGQSVQEACFARTCGTGDDLKPQAQCQLTGVLHHLCSKGFVTTFYNTDLKANLAQHQGQRTTALAATPTVNQGAPTFR